MAEKIESPEAVKAAWPSISKGVDDAAFALAVEFQELGLGPREAGSAVANVLLRAAWKVAGCAALAAGDAPRPELFAEAAADTTRLITFKDAPGDHAPSE